MGYEVWRPVNDANSIFGGGVIVGDLVCQALRYQPLAASP